MSRKMVFLIATLLIVTNGVVCLAQVEQGAITGAVTDSTGASILKAKVTATNQATGAVATAETTDDGYYKIPYLLAGRYTVVVEMVGFAAHRVTDVPVLVGQNATINATLKPGSVHDEVTVVANAVMVDQVSSSLGYVLGYVTDATQIMELPIGRNTYSLVNLAPGVIATGNTGTGPIVNGGRSNKSNTTAILLDGQDTRNNSTLDNAYTLPRRRFRKCASLPTVSRPNTAAPRAAFWLRPEKQAPTRCTEAFMTT